MSRFTLNGSYRFTRDQIQVVLDEMAIKGKRRRLWIKVLSRLDINTCVYNVIGEIRENLWIGGDEFQRTLLKNYTSKWMVRQIISECDIEDNIEAYFMKLLTEELEAYMACLSSDKTLFTLIRGKREIQFKNGRQSSVDEKDTRYHYYKNYKALTIEFDSVVQYKFYVFQLLYRAQFKKPSHLVIAKGFMEDKFFEREIQRYEESMEEETSINRYWFYNLISQMILSGEWIDNHKIYQCLSLYKYAEGLSLDCSFLRLFAYEPKKKRPILIEDPYQNDDIPIRQWQKDYFRNQGLQLLKKIDACKDVTTRILYLWMFHENPWRFLMFQALLKRLYVDIDHPMLKDKGVFTLMMNRLGQWENSLNQDLKEKLDKYLAVMYYEKMKTKEGQDYLEDILLYLDH